MVCMDMGFNDPVQSKLIFCDIIYNSISIIMGYSARCIIYVHDRIYHSTGLGNGITDSVADGIC